MPRYDIHAVKAAAQGHWDAIFAALAPMLAQAQERPGQHVPCPVHGGTDGFRLFKHYAEKGDGICNTCGARTDGFDMLCWVNGWTFVQALTEVAKFLGLKPENAHRPSEAPKTKAAASDSGRDVQTFSGTIVRAGMREYKDTGRKAFGVDLLQLNGLRITCWGIELQTAVKAAGAKRGDKVALVKLRTEERVGSKGPYRVNIWRCDLLKNKTREALPKASERTPEIPSPAAPRPTTPQPTTPHAEIPQTETLQPETPAAQPASTDKSPRMASIEKMWSIAKIIRKDRRDAAPVLKYFEHRGLKDAEWDDESLRFVPNAFYRSSKEGETERWPALVAAVRKVDGTLVTLHRTFLTEDGRKAPVEEVKKLMALPEGATINGASIQLGKPGERLCLAEGIETALSVQYATGIPCWCAISANGLKTVEIPEGVKTVLIFADKDKSDVGSLAAEALRDRLADEGRFVIIVNIPDAIPSGAKGIDWNDVLRMKGIQAFPVRRR